MFSLVVALCGSGEAAFGREAGDGDNGGPVTGTGAGDVREDTVGEFVLEASPIAKDARSLSSSLALAEDLTSIEFVDACPLLGPGLPERWAARDFRK